MAYETSARMLQRSWTHFVYIFFTVWSARTWIPPIGAPWIKVPLYRAILVVWHLSSISVVEKDLNTPNWSSSMADNAIVRGGAGGLVSPFYICGLILTVCAVRGGLLTRTYPRKTLTCEYPPPMVFSLCNRCANSTSFIMLRRGNWNPWWLYKELTLKKSKFSRGVAFCLNFFEGNNWYK